MILSLYLFLRNLSSAYATISAFFVAVFASRAVFTSGACAFWVASSSCDMLIKCINSSTKN
mgnify:CR=1 FL=1